MARKKPKKVSLAPSEVRTPSGLKKDGTPNAAWTRLINRLENHKHVPLQNWGAEEVLGYIIERYNKYSDLEFALSYRGAPSKCSEIYCVNRMMKAVGTRKGWILKEYIDWVFDQVVIPNNKQIKSLAFFFSPNLCKRFREIFKNNNKITRSTTIPEYYKSVAEEVNVPVETYGDLAFARLAVKTSPDDYPSYVNLLNRLSEAGLDVEILDQLED